MDSEDFQHTLQFQQQTVLDLNIKPEEFLEDHPLVFDFYLPLVNRLKFAQLEFTNHASFIYTFDQSRPFQPMNFNRRANRSMAHFISGRKKSLLPFPLRSLRYLL